MAIALIVGAGAGRTTLRSPNRCSVFGTSEGFVPDRRCMDYDDRSSLEIGCSLGRALRATMALLAVQHVRRMRGGAQAHLMRTADGAFYVVKSQNNPQHLRVLANELLATRLAEALDLPVPRTEVVEVTPELVAISPELTIELAGRASPCRPGLQFGSRYLLPPEEGQVFDYLPEPLLGNVKNLDSFAGMLALDKWTCNADGRQAAFCRRHRERKYRAWFIDQGYCFNAGEWSFPDSPLRGVYLRNEVYIGVTGWESFEPWLSQIENVKEDVVWDCAALVPPEWYGDWDDMQRLVETLLKRRALVRRLIADFRFSSRLPFPNWVTGGRCQGTRSIN